MTTVRDIVRKTRECYITQEVLGEIIQDAIDSAVDYGMVLAQDPEVTLVKSKATEHRFELNNKKLHNAINMMYGFAI